MQANQKRALGYGMVRSLGIVKGCGRDRLSTFSLQGLGITCCVCEWFLPGVSSTNPVDAVPCGAFAELGW